MVGRMPAWKETAIVVAAWVGAAVWVVLPIDPVPDFIPLIGWLDDIAVVTGAAALTAWWTARRSTTTTSVPAAFATPFDEPTVRRPTTVDYDPIPSEQLRDW